MAQAKRSPRSEGADRGRALQVDCLRGNVNYSKLRQAAQPLVDMGYSLETYKVRSQIDDWFSVYGLLFLTKAEYFVLRFIVSRTVNYGKTSEIIFKSHFLEGIQAGGEWKAAPCGVNSRDLYASISSLEERGIIQTSRLQNGSRHLATLYTLDIEALLSLRETPRMALKIAKKHRGTVVPIGTNPPTKEGCQLAPKKSIQIKTNNNDGVCARTRRIARTRKVENEINCKQDVVARVTAIGEAAATRTATKQLSKVRRGRAAAPGAITLTDLNATWKRCMVNVFGTCSIVGLTHIEYGIFKKVIKTHELSFAWEDFFTWAIQAWSAINEDHRSRSEYAKAKTSGWSMKATATHYLTTSTPMLSSVVKNFGKLLRTFVERSSIPTVNVSELQARLDVAEKEKRAAQAQVSRLSQLRAPVPTSSPSAPRPKVALKIIARPEEDTFFDELDELPEWREA